MNHEQPFTPTVPNVLHCYIDSVMRAGLGLNTDEAEAEYDRFVEKVRNDALREAALSGLFGSNAQRTLLHMAGEDTP